MPPPPLLFDLDGTLADTLGDIAASANHVRSLADLAPLDLDTVRGMVGDGARKLCERALAGNSGGVTVDDVFAQFQAHHREQCTKTAELYPGARAWLEERHARGAAMAVVTNKPEEFAQRIVDHLEIRELFPVVIGGDSLAERKPHPAPLLAALERLGAPRGAGTMIGDGPQDIRAGRAAGLHTVGVLFGFSAEEPLLAEGADDYWTRFGG